VVDETGFDVSSAEPLDSTTRKVGSQGVILLDGYRILLEQSLKRLVQFKNLGVTL
jgi:hypothetical protein